jgi:hypothetical protein
MVDTIETPVEQPKEPLEKTTPEPATEAHLEASAAREPSVEVDQGEDASDVLVVPGKELVPVSTVTPGVAAVRYTEQAAKDEGSEKDPRFFSTREKQQRAKAEENAAEPETQTSGSGSGQPPTGEKPTPSDEEEPEQEPAKQQLARAIQKGLDDYKFSSPDYNKFFDELRATIAQQEEEESQGGPGNEESTTDTTGSDKTGEVEKADKQAPSKKIFFIEEATNLISPETREAARQKERVRLEGSPQEKQDTPRPLFITGDKDSQGPEAEDAKEAVSPASGSDDESAIGMTGSGKTGNIGAVLRSSETATPPALVFQTGSKEDYEDLPEQTDTIKNDPLELDPSESVEEAIARITETWMSAYELSDPFRQVLEQSVERLYRKHKEQGTPLTLDRLHELTLEAVQKAEETSESGATTEFAQEQVREVKVGDELIVTNPNADWKDRVRGTANGVLQAFAAAEATIPQALMPIVYRAVERFYEESKSSGRPLDFEHLSTAIREEIDGAFQYNSRDRKILRDDFEDGKARFEARTAQKKRDEGAK